MEKLFLYVLIIIGSSNCFATEITKPKLPSFEFRGHKFGEPKEKFFADPYICSTHKDPTLIICDDPDTNNVQPYKRKIADLPVNYLQYTFQENKLVQVTMAFDTKYFLDFKAMLIGKYGIPSSQRHDIVQNRLGAKFDDHFVGWNFAEGELKLGERALDMDTSLLLIFDKKKSDVFNKNKDEATKLKGKNAF